MATSLILIWIFSGIFLSSALVLILLLRTYNKIQGNAKVDVTRIVNYIVWMAKEMVNTLSSKKSHFSSKRIERLFLFASGVCIMDLYAYTHRLMMTPESMLMIVGAQMIWAGFNTTQLNTDKKLNNPEKPVPTDESGPDGV